MKKRWIAWLLLLCLCCGVFSAWAEEGEAEAEQPVGFADVSAENEAFEAVMYLAERGIVNGKTETEFCPDDGLKREEFAKILAAAFSLTAQDNAPVFYDVPAGTWYADFVRSVSAAGYMQGISDTLFGTGMALSRQDLAVLLKRYADAAKLSLSSDNTVLYADAEETAAYAREAAMTLAAANVMPGRSDNLWHPQAEATRAEAAAALYQMLMLQKQQTEALGRYGDVGQYDGPYDVPTDDRLAESMPTPFDANIWPRQEILYEDFEDSDYGLLKQGYFPANATFDYENGYNSKGCIKMKDGGGMARMVWTAKNGVDVTPGDYLVFSCMIKGEGISGEGNYRNILQFYDDKGKWLDETHALKQNKDADWTEYQQILQVPEGVNALTEAEYYTVNLVAYMNDLSGTVYFDDFKLYKIIFDPMDTVLMAPSYKGIIKGENGVGDIALRAYVNDLNGLYDLSQFKMEAQITDENHKVYMQSQSNMVTAVTDIYFSSADLPMDGDYYLETILSYKESGEQLQKSEWMLHKRPADFKTQVGYDEYGRVTKNGEAVLPIRMYNYSEYDDVVADILASGNIDELLHSGMGWYYNFGSNETYRDMVQKLAENNVTISLATGSMCFSNMYTGEVKNRVKQQSDIRGLLSKMVNNFKDLPNLFSYYLFDEQNAMRYGEELAWARKIVESLDLDHPTTCAIDNPISFRPGIYAKTSDFLGYDPYPVTGKKDQDISMVYDRISEAIRNNPNRPVYAIIQNFWYDTRGDLRGPTQQEYRNMIFQALCAGSCMIDSWAYRWTKEKPNPGRTFEEDWADMTEVFAELQYLEPILLSVAPAPYYEIKGGGDWLNHMSRRYDGKSYFFAVNNQAEGKTAKLYLDGVKKIRGMYSGKELTANEDGWFETELDGYEVEVYEYEQADYKSSHAELIRFAAAGCMVENAEEDSPIIMMNGADESFTYQATISDGAALYINGSRAETSGTVQTEGLSSVTLKVVSEDGRFETLKTYQIEHR